MQLENIEISKIEMRKLLLTTFVSVISTGMPAYAVDYIACREMLRTKNEFIQISKVAEVQSSIAKESENLKGANMFEVCRDKKKDNLGHMTIFEQAIEESKFSQNEMDCWKRMGNAGVKGKHQFKGRSFHTQTGLSYYIKALKVEADMRRANCPY